MESLGAGFAASRPGGDGRRALRIDPDLVNSDRTSDVLEPPFAKFDKLFVDLVAHLAIGVLGEIDGARLGKSPRAGPRHSPRRP